MSETEFLAALHAELDCFAQRLAAGFDIAPARRARCEGMIAAGLALGIDSAVLLESCRAHLPAQARVELEPARLFLWQRRAPVEPGT